MRVAGLVDGDLLTVDGSGCGFVRLFSHIEFMVFRLTFLVNFILLFGLGNSNAQDLARVRNVINVLASPSFHGRGYVNGGDSLAAEFVANEFKLSGLRSFQETYYQPFTFPVNTFPGKMKVKINNKKLVPGRDFILNAGSKGVKGRFKLTNINLDSTLFELFPLDKDHSKNNSDMDKKSKEMLKKSALIFHPEWRKNIKKLPLNTQNNLAKIPLIVEEIPKKLTYSVATKVENKCIVQILSKDLPVKPKSIKISVENSFVERHKARNVIGIIDGTSKKDSFLVITAHYDHLGHLGKKTYFPGANDNASGVAMMLELARYYSEPSHKLPYSLMFIGFAGEEAGLLGSSYYVNDPLFPLEKIKFLINLDLLGSGKEGITVVNGSVFPKKFAILDSINNSKHGLSKIVARGKAANSDHYPFSEKGVPAFFIYTLGEITAYHDIDDKPQVVTLSKFKEVFELINEFFLTIKH